MFSWEPRYGAPTEYCPQETFLRVIRQQWIKWQINRIREKVALKNAILAKAEAAGAELTDEEKAEVTKLKQDQDRLKRKLPSFIFQSTFKETDRNAGVEGKAPDVGMWRKQKSVVLNGLFILDIDHFKNPIEWLTEKRGELDMQAWCEQNRIMLLHVTSSGEGLRFVLKADAEFGNIADHQNELADKWGVKIDDSCVDASRTSYVPYADDILYINNDIFNYNNEKFEEKWGENYRNGNSSATRPHGDSAPASGSRSSNTGGGAADTSEKAPSDEKILEKTFRGVTYGKIINEWIRQNYPGGAVEGERHHCLLQLGCDLRYITDQNAELVEGLLAQCSVGQQIRAEGGTAEIARIASGAANHRLFMSIPQRLQSVLDSCGVRKGEAGANEDTATKIDYDAWWHRLEPLLNQSPGFAEAVAPLPDSYKLAGVLAAGAMFGTYLSRCWWDHFDGKPYRLSYLVYIIGRAASGKSFVIDLDRLIMAPMLATDNAGREWERQYKEEMKKRSASSKNAKEAAPEQQHPVIRYVPSSVSNAMLYRRLTDAKDPSCTDRFGAPLHLHCYTCDAELTTPLRVQTGSWAGKEDLECKSFQNEWAGVDYANDASTNGIIEINWNQVISGTPDAMRKKVHQGRVLDGLVTRLCLFMMPGNDFEMLERRTRVVEGSREEYLKSVGMELEKIAGNLACEKLVDYAYQYEVDLTDEARNFQDRCLDYFRKRIPIIMIRYTLVRAVLRQLKELQEGKELVIDDSDLEFAKLIGDIVLDMQIYFFGKDVMRALEDQDKAFTVMSRTSRKVTDQFNLLPETFTRDQLKETCDELGKSAISMRLSKWLEEGLIEKLDKSTFKKLKPIE